MEATEGREDPIVRAVWGQARWYLHVGRPRNDSKNRLPPPHQPTHGMEPPQIYTYANTYTYMHIYLLNYPQYHLPLPTCCI